LPPVSNVHAASTDLRDLVQQLADDLGVLYAPIGKSTSEGKPLYTFGKATIYTDRGVIFARKPDTSFHPVSMSELPSIARA
jgi:tuftelin-interacting protein 11